LGISSSQPGVSYTPGQPQPDAASELAQRIFSECGFDGKAIGFSTPPEAVQPRQRGVCQVYAQPMNGGLRSIGLPRCAT
jgi:hypothetical protein